MKTFFMLAKWNCLGIDHYKDLRNDR